MPIGELIRNARMRAGWTQEQLATEAGLSAVQISRIETGARGTRIDTLARLAKLLGIDPKELLEEQPEPRADPTVQALRRELAAIRSSLEVCESLLRKLKTEDP